MVSSNGVSLESLGFLIIFQGALGAICPESRDHAFSDLENKCYPCAVKITVVDSPHNNLYAFCEMVIISLSSVLGYRPEEDEKERYQHVVSSHGFAPGDVPQDLFTDPEGM